jgi:hypothetical protein
MKIERVVKIQKSGSNTRLEIPSVFVELWNGEGFALEQGDPFCLVFEDGKLIGEPQPMKTMKCNNCGHTLKLNNLHKRSLPVPEEGKFHVVCVSCAGVEKPGSKNAEKTWVVEEA